MRLKPKSPIAQAAAIPADSFETPIAQAVARRRIIAFALLGIGAYALGLIWTIPASVAFHGVPWRTGVAGTVWNGEVGVAGGTVVRWHWAPLRSLTSLGFAADWKATGPDTDLGGQVLKGFSSTRFDAVSGSADMSLLQVIQPNLPFDCTLTAQVEMQRIVSGGSGQMMQGQVVTDPGSCRARGAGAPTALPSLVWNAEKVGKETRITLAPAAQRRKLLITATLAEDGTVDMTVTPDGAEALPFLGARPGMRIQGEM